MKADDSVKVKGALQGEGSAGFGRYRSLCYGRTSLGHALWAECLTSICGPMPGAAGYFLRSKLYRGLFAEAGRKALIGRNVTFRHFKKIRLGEGVIIDDNAVVDAKGTDNEGIALGDGVFVGRNSIVYCKNGNIRLAARVNVSSNCTVFSSNDLAIGEGTIIGGYTYILSGGEYDYRNPTPFAEQSGMETRGPLTIGANCWLGTRVTVLDGASIGEHCVVGAGSVVTKPLPDHSLALGVPARVIKRID